MYETVIVYAQRKNNENNAGTKGYGHRSADDHEDSQQDDRQSQYCKRTHSLPS